MFGFAGTISSVCFPSTIDGNRAAYCGVRIWEPGESPVASSGTTRISQCQKPTGWLGRFSLWRMNASHSKLTDWGLRHVTVEKRHTILDVGCGGGRTVSKLAAMTT